ncbi:MAG: hypothetical protein KJ963_03845 [Bacteroidetes bacterium]|nr:hypothetical protein [Bacteroidota bacterium]MBU2636202.1 hypothetical protein [Bacteroidota bacterium]
MKTNIQEVKSKKDLKKFIRFPFDLYKNNPYWIPPMIHSELQTFQPKKNPAFDYCDAKYWLAYRENIIVGRIVGIINHRSIEIWKKKNARFGWIDFIDDFEVSKILLETVENWAKSKGMEAVHGPLGFTDMDHEGMLIEGFNELGTLATIYNHTYYPIHMESHGYVKDADWMEYEVKVPTSIPEKAEKIAQIVLERKKIKVLKFKKSKDLLPYAHKLFKVLNESFVNLYSFVSLTDKQINLYVKQYFPNIVPDFVKVLIDEKDEVAGFVIAMPSLSRAMQKTKGRMLPFGFIHFLKALKSNKYIDLYLGAIRPDLQGKGADALLMTELAKTCIERGIISAETNPELEENVKVQSHWKYFESRQHKRRRCYIKYLSR